MRIPRCAGLEEAVISSRTGSVYISRRNMQIGTYRQEDEFIEKAV